MREMKSRIYLGTQIIFAAFAALMASCGGDTGEAPATDKEAPAEQTAKSEGQGAVGFLNRPDSIESPAVAAGGGSILLAGIVKRADGSGADLMAARARADGAIEAEWRLAGRDGEKAKGKVALLRSAGAESEFIVLAHWAGARNASLWRIADGTEPGAEQEIDLPNESDKAVKFPDISLLSHGGEDYLLYLVKEEGADDNLASLMMLRLGEQSAKELERFDGGDACRIEGVEAGHLGLAVCWSVAGDKFREAFLAIYGPDGSRLAGPEGFYNGRRNYSVYLHQDSAADDALVLWGAKRKYSYQRFEVAGGKLKAAYEISPNKRFDGTIAGFWREDERYFVAVLAGGARISSARFDEGAFNARSYRTMVDGEEIGVSGFRIAALSCSPEGAALLIAHSEGYIVRLSKP